MGSRIRRALRDAVRKVVRRLHAVMERAVEEDLPPFGNDPRNLRIELPRRIFEPQCMVFGDDVALGPNALLVAQTHYPTSVMQDRERLRPVQRFHPRIRIGHRVTSSGGLTVAAMQEVVIDDDVMLAGNVLISDGLHGFDRVDEPYKYQPMSRIAPVHIGRGSWLGQNVVVMPGVSVGEMAIIGANSVVTRDVPARSIAVGNPARVIKRWDAKSARWVPAGAREPQGIRTQSG